MDIDLLGEDGTKYCQMNSTTRQKVFIMAVPILLGLAYGWYFYDMFQILYGAIIPNKFIMSMYVISGWGSVYFCFFSTLMSGFQTLVTMSGQAISYSHLELGKRFQVLTQSAHILNSKPLRKSGTQVAQPVKGHEQDAFVLLNKADKLIDEHESTNQKFESAVFFLCSYYLIMTTLLSYGCLTTMVSEINPAKRSLAVSYTLFFISYLFVFFVLSNESQKIIDSQKATIKIMGTTIFRCQGLWSESTREFAIFVKAKYDKIIPLSPYSFFSLDRSGFLNTVALVFTYLIVLLQFKTTE